MRRENPGGRSQATLPAAQQGSPAGHCEPLAICFSDNSPPDKPAGPLPKHRRPSRDHIERSTAELRTGLETLQEDDARVAAELTEFRVELATVAERTGGRSLEANVALLRNNARTAAAVATAMASAGR